MPTSAAVGAAEESDASDSSSCTLVMQWAADGTSLPVGGHGRAAAHDRPQQGPQPQNGQQQPLRESQQSFFTPSPPSGLPPPPPPVQVPMGSGSSGASVSAQQEAEEAEAERMAAAAMDAIEASLLAAEAEADAKAAERAGYADGSAGRLSLGGPVSPVEHLS
jgi:hypothetical protein